MENPMLNKIEVQEALRRSQETVSRIDMNKRKPVNDQDPVISLLIHDIFGGEMLKTHNKNGWHFYNRIDGERIDFSTTKNTKSIEDNNFDDLPVTPDETSNYFDIEDYSDFFMRFIHAFEETVGLDKHKVSYQV
jgi:phage pi2 protein 07